MTTGYRWYNWKVTRLIRTTRTLLSLRKHVGNQWDTTNYNNHTSSVSDTQTMWCLSPNTLLSCFSNKNNNLLSHYHVCQDKLSSPDTMSDNIFLPNESVAESCDSFTLTKGRYKFGNLQIYCYESNASPSSGCWTSIPGQLEVDYIASMGKLNISITVPDINMSPHYFDTCKILIHTYLCSMEYINIWYRMYNVYWHF